MASNSDVIVVGDEGAADSNLPDAVKNALRQLVHEGNGSLSRDIKLKILNIYHEADALHRSLANIDYSSLIPCIFDGFPAVRRKIIDTFNLFIFNLQRYDRLKFFSGKHKELLEKMKETGCKYDALQKLLTEMAEQYGWIDNIPKVASLIAVDDRLKNKSIKIEFNDSSSAEEVSSPSRITDTSRTSISSLHRNSVIVEPSLVSPSESRSSRQNKASKNSLKKSTETVLPNTSTAGSPPKRNGTAGPLPSTGHSVPNGNAGDTFCNAMSARMQTTKLRWHSPSFGTDPNRPRLLPASNSSNIPLIDLADPNFELEESDSSDASKDSPERPSYFDNRSGHDGGTGMDELEHAETADDASTDIPPDRMCSCGEPSAGFMIACDSCNTWYHGECVNMTRNKARNIVKYYCPKCGVPQHGSEEVNNEDEAAAENDEQDGGGPEAEEDEQEASGVVRPIEDFTDLSEIFKNGVSGTLLPDFRAAAFKQMQLTPDTPENFREFDFGPCVPSPFRNDALISASIARAIARHASSYQCDQRVVRVIRNSVPLLKPLLQSGVRPTKRMLTSIFAQTIQNSPPGVRQPGVKSVVDRATLTFLMRSCGLQWTYPPANPKIPSTSKKSTSESHKKRKSAQEQSSSDDSLPSRPLKKARWSTEERVNVRTRKMTLADERRRSVTSKDGTRIEDFKSPDEIYTFGQGGVLTNKYRKTAIECLRISASYPQSFTDFDVDSAIPSFLLDDHQAVFLLRQRLMEAVKEYQCVEKARTIYRELASELHELIRDNATPSVGKLKVLFKRAIRERNFVNPPTTTFLVHNAHIDNIRRAITESGIEAGNGNETTDEYFNQVEEQMETVKQEADESEDYLAHFENPPVAQSENAEENLDSVQENPNDWNVDGGLQQDNGEEAYAQQQYETSQETYDEPRSLFDTRLVKTEPAEEMANVAVSAPEYNVPPQSFVEERNARVAIDDDGEGSEDGDDQTGTSVHQIEDYRQPAQIYKRAFRAGVAKKVLRKGFRQAVLTRLGVTADHPQTLLNFDVSAAVPPFMKKNSSVAKLLRQKITKTVREYQRGERAKKVYSIALQELGVDSDSARNLPQEELSTAVQRAVDIQNWKDNVPSLVYVFHRASSKFFGQSLGERSQHFTDESGIFNASANDSGVPELNSSAANQSSFISVHSPRIAAQNARLSLNVTPAEENRGVAQEDPNQSYHAADIASFTNYDQIYKTYGEHILQYDYRRAALNVLRITYEHPENFADFDLSPAIPPFVFDDPEGHAILEKRLSLAARQSQRHFRAHRIISLSAAHLKQLVERGQELSEPNLRPIFEKVMKANPWNTNTPGISLVIDRATRAVIMKTIGGDPSSVPAIPRLSRSSKGEARISNVSRPESFSMVRDRDEESTVAKDINEFTSHAEIFKHGGSGMVTECYRRSAFQALGITADFPESYNDFDFTPAIPPFYLNSASEREIQELRNTLRRMCTAYQICARTKDVMRSAASSIVTVNAENEDEELVEIKKILKRVLEEKNWKEHVPTMKHLTHLVRTSKSKSGFGFASMEDIYVGGANDGEITEDFRLASLARVGISVDHPDDFDTTDFSPAIPTFLARNEVESSLLKQKLRAAAIEYQRSLRVKEVIEWAMPTIHAAKVSGKKLGEKDLKLLFAKGIEILRRPGRNPDVNTILKSFSEETETETAEESAATTDAIDVESPAAPEFATPLLRSDIQQPSSSTSRPPQKRSLPADSPSTSSSIDAPPQKVNKKPSDKKGRHSYHDDAYSVTSEKAESFARPPTSSSTASEETVQEQNDMIDEMTEGLDQIPEAERMAMVAYLRKEANRKLVLRMLEMTSGLSRADQTELIRKTIFDRPYKAQ